MVNTRTIFAILQKQIKDVLKNTQVLVLFLIFPIIGCVMTTAMKQSGQTAFFISVFGTMHAVFTPIVTTAAIISEEKEKNTLRALIMSNVKPLEYLLSIGGFVFICTNVTGIAFAFLGNFGGFDTIRFMLYMMLGSVCSIILGSAIGVHSKNMMSSNALAVPLGMAFAFLPMLASFNQTIEKISRFTYGQQISYLLSDPSNKNFPLECCLIISINLVILITAFVIVYRKNRFED